VFKPGFASLLDVGAILPAGEHGFMEWPAPSGGTARLAVI
jgi:hypothetical protein